MSVTTPPVFTTKIISVFFIGAFISALGTHTFIGAGLAFMREAGVTLAQVGMVVMFSRLAAFLMNFILGDLLDRYHPRHTILGAEIINVLITIGLIWVWPSVLPNFNLFLLLVFCRSALIAVVGPSQQKLIKLFFKDDMPGQARAAVLLNLMNVGSLVITLLVCWYAIKYGSFTHLLVFDGLTFIFNGVVVFCLPHGLFPKTAKMTFNVFSKFGHYKKLESGLVVKDVLLHLTVFGTNILMIRLAGSEVANIPLFLLSFGISVWISTFLIKRFTVARVATISWLLLPLPFAVLYFYHQHFAITFSAVLVRNIIYWNLYNHHSVQVQTLSPPEHTASIAAARSAIIMLIMGCGEALMGQLSQHITLDAELVVRFSSCLLFSSYYYAKK